MMEDEGHRPLAMSLVEACPAITEMLNSHREELNVRGIALQLDAVWVASQVVAGTENDFSFMAYPIPRPTLAERRLMELVDEESIVISENNTSIRIDLDDFGRVNWFYVKNLPFAFQQITRSLLKKKTSAA